MTEQGKAIPTTVIPGGLVAYMAWTQQELMYGVTPRPSTAKHNGEDYRILSAESIFEAPKNRSYILVQLQHIDNQSRINLEFES